MIAAGSAYPSGAGTLQHPGLRVGHREPGEPPGERGAQVAGEPVGHGWQPREVDRLCSQCFLISS